MDNISMLIQKAQAGDKEARNRMVEENLGLVHHIVKRFLGRGYESEDLFQIGTIGLMKAIDKFDLSLGLKFSTYAVPMITGEIKRFLRDDGIIKVSRSMKENAVKIGMARHKLQNQLHREPTLEEIAKETNLSSEEVVFSMEANIEVESIYHSVTGEDGNESYLVDKVVMSEGGSVGMQYGRNHMDFAKDNEKDKIIDRMLITQLMQELKEQERVLIQMRYFQNRTQTEIAKNFGISQVQVSRLEKKVLLHLRELVN